MSRAWVIGLFGSLLLVSAAPGGEPGQVLVGTYTADEFGGSGPIRAAFTAVQDEGSGSDWTVVFTVTMDTADYLYKGTAQGALDSGELSGDVADSSGKRTFMFRGQHRNGAFHATHAETTDGFLTLTGTMTLRREEDPE